LGLRVVPIFGNDCFNVASYHAKMFDFSPVYEAIASQVFSRNYILMCS